MGIPHLLINDPNGQMRVIQQGEPFQGRVLEKFNQRLDVCGTLCNNTHTLNN